MNFKNISVQMKTLLIVLISAPLLLGSTIYAVVAMQKIGVELQEVTVDDMPLTRHLTEVTVAILHQATYMEKALRYGESMATDASDRVTYEETLRAFDKSSAETDSIYQDILNEIELAIDHAINYQREKSEKEYNILKDEVIVALNVYSQFIDSFNETRRLIDNGHMEKAHRAAYKTEDLADLASSTTEKATFHIEKFTETSLREVLEHEQTALTIVMGLMIAGLLSGIFSGWYVGQSISRPLADVTMQINTMAEGNTDLTVTVDENRRDEIGTLQKAASVFLESLKNSQKLEDEKRLNLQAQQEKFAVREQLTSHFDSKVESILGEVNIATEQMGGAAASLTEVASQTNSQATAVSTAAIEAASNVQTVATAAQELSVSLEEISRRVTESNESMSETAQKAHETNEIVENLKTSAVRVGEVVEMIEKVAEQTNLLALNATIEAARAGEAGKGFNVVASEVKALAGETGKATEEITSQISQMQAQTERAVSVITDMSRMIHDVSEHFSSIAAAVEQQNAATAEISQNVQQAAAGTDEVTTKITSVSDGAQTTGAAATQVSDAIRSVSEHTISINELITDFLERVKSA